MWFLYTILVTLCWGIADLFYKKGSDPKDRYSAQKITIMVGFVMGIHAIAYMIVNQITFNPIEIIRYLPVSALYIISMVFGYVGLRYIELSVSSPVQNSSGAVTAILCLIFLRQFPTALQAIAIIAITVGIVVMAYLERKDDAEAIKNADKKYVTGFKAIMFPILYCIIDGLGTFADALYLNEANPLISEDNALLAYEFTFLIVGVILLLYITIVKKERYRLPEQKNRIAAAVFETAGQFFYVFIIGANAVVAAPVIASYCVVSMALSAIFLKEKLKKSQYLVIALVVIGIIVLGIADGLAGDF